MRTKKVFAEQRVLEDFMPTLLVKNNEKGPTVFSDLGENIQIEWQGRGDKEGRDLMRVPDKLLENVNFRRTLDRGVLELVNPTPEMEAMISQQADAAVAHRAEQDAAIENLMDRTTDRDIVTAVVDEKGAIVSHQTDDRSEREGDQPEKENPQATNTPASTGSTVQMDEDGQPIEGEPELQVTIEPPQKG